MMACRDECTIFYTTIYLQVWGQHLMKVTMCGYDQILCMELYIVDQLCSVLVELQLF